MLNLLFGSMCTEVNWGWLALANRPNGEWMQIVCFFFFFFNEI